jgi:hypothetical protein
MRGLGAVAHVCVGTVAEVPLLADSVEKVVFSGNATLNLAFNKEPIHHY